MSVKAAAGWLTGLGMAMRGRLVAALRGSFARGQAVIDEMVRPDKKCRLRLFQFRWIIRW